MLVSWKAALPWRWRQLWATGYQGVLEELEVRSGYNSGWDESPGEVDES